MSTAVNRLTPGPRVHKNPGSKTDYWNITCNNGREATLYPSPPKKKQLWFYVEMINEELNINKTTTVVESTFTFVIANR